MFGGFIKMLYFCGLLQQVNETKYMRKVVDVKEKVITTNSIINFNLLCG